MDQLRIVDEKAVRRPKLQGIVILGGRASPVWNEPRIAAFIWGGKVRPTPVLPFGRWKGAA